MLRTTIPTVARALARALAATADHCFGLMGNGNAHLIDALLSEGVAYTAVRHEAGTVAAADAYTRVSGLIAIATVIKPKLPIPGVKNVISVATTMPTPAQTMPLRAVTGELMRFKPRMNSAAATK